MSLFKILDSALSGKRPCSVLMRHAERFPFADYGDEPLLTERGHNDAYELGKELVPLSPLRIFHSPIERCHQTACGICRGVRKRKKGCEISGVIEMLGPSLFIVDREGIMRSLEKNEAGFLRLWFDGKMPENVILPVEKAARRMLSFMVDQLSGDSVSTINVSHDWIILALLERYFPLRYEEMEYPGFLSGVVALRDGEKIHLQYGEHSCRIDPVHGL
ncbi:MAG: histidine phosphatase family protein [Spirochaetes bacterium]|nr:histidine phosphatase family protein [Spirochaetota bacterium]